jgi:5-methylthioribose kinase
MSAHRLDIERPEALLEYLRRNGCIGASERAEVRKLEGGVSNRTVLVTRADGEAWVLKQALEKLRVPVDWFSRPERIEREAAGLRWLPKLAPPEHFTPLVFEDPAEHLLAMQAVPQPHDNWKSVLLAGSVEPYAFREFGAMLAGIHRQSYLRRDEVQPEFEDRSFFETLRLEPYYRYTAGQVPGSERFLNALIDDTLGLRIALVHGDFSPKNVLIHAGRLILLDHEVIHFGDPAFDLGFSLTHFASKAHHLPGLRNRLLDAAREYWLSYEETLGDLPWAGELEARAVRHTLACLLARVAGRSCLEYLDAGERSRQRQVVVSMLDAPPVGVPAALTELIERLEACQK